MKYDNEHLEKVKEAATALQQANDNQSEAAAVLSEAQNQANIANDMVEEYTQQYEELIGKTPLARLRK